MAVHRRRGYEVAQKKVKQKTRFGVTDSQVSKSGAPAFASIRPKRIRKPKRQQKESFETEWQLAAEEGSGKSEVRGP